MEFYRKFYAAHCHISKLKEPPPPHLCLPRSADTTHFRGNITALYSLDLCPHHLLILILFESIAVAHTVLIRIRVSPADSCCIVSITIRYTRSSHNDERCAHSCTRYVRMGRALFVQQRPISCEYAHIAHAAHARTRIAAHNTRTYRADTTDAHCSR